LRRERGRQPGHVVAAHDTPGTTAASAFNDPIRLFRMGPPRSPRPTRAAPFPWHGDGGRPAFAYTATTGHLTARRLATDTPDASMFYVAYTLDGADPATRPVTFLYNGGPGSASLWLHLGSFGPKRLAAQAPSTSVATPFPFVDNAESLLDVTDLVFVDAVGHRLLAGDRAEPQFDVLGVDPDAAVFRDFIRRYVAVNSRTASPSSFSASPTGRREAPSWRTCSSRPACASPASSSGRRSSTTTPIAACSWVP
jgi:hypothetical protein